MITLSDLKAKANRQFDKILKAAVSAENIFPLVIKGNKSIDKSQGWESISEQQEELLIYSKNKTGVGFTIELQENKRTKQSEICKIYFESEQDFIAFIEKEEEFTAFKANTQHIITTIPVLKFLFQERPLIIIENKDKWNDLLQICQYFLQNPQPNLYVRNLPIAISTKFIENNQSVLRILLDFLLGDKVNISESDFFKRFGLQIEEPSIKVRFLDESASFHQSISCVSVWVSEFNQWYLNCQNVYIIENLTTFLSFPKRANSIAIWGGGFAVHLLKNADWLKNRTLYYWGDIDVHGFQILSQIRVYFPKIISIMMDAMIFNHFHKDEKGDNFKIIEMSNLTTEEKHLYDIIEANNWRLEQEKIPISYVSKKLV